jgi:hypothetical protein
MFSMVFSFVRVAMRIPGFEVVGVEACVAEAIRNYEAGEGMSTLILKMQMQELSGVPDGVW